MVTRCASISFRPPYQADCPFCPGNEHLTPGATAQYDDGSWSVRMVPNKFPALTPAAGFELGSGIYINVALPEETAPFMRSIAA